MRDKIIFLIILNILLLTGCKYRVIDRTESSGKQTESTETSIMNQYLNEDGLYEKDGYVYKYYLEIDGRMNNTDMRTSYALLSNTRNITFEDVSQNLISSNTEDFIRQETAMIVGITTYKNNINNGIYVDYDDGTFASIQLEDNYIIYKESIYSVEEQFFNYSVEGQEIHAWNVYNEKQITIIDEEAVEYRGVKYTYQETATEPVTDEDKPEYEINSTGYPIYDGLIRKMLVISTHENESAELYEIEGVSAAFRYVEPASWGYYLNDIDGDGIHELFLGDRSMISNSAYDIFTIKDDKLVKLLEGSKIYVCQDKFIYETYNVGAPEWYNDFYKYEDGQLELVESVWHDGTEPEDYPYHYHINTMNEDETLLITWEKANPIINKYEIQKISYTPFVKGVIQ